MTTVYGVTFIGAREQIEKQLKDRGDIAPEDAWNGSSYLAKVVRKHVHYLPSRRSLTHHPQVLSCIGDLFSGAKHIQMWLNTCAKLISKSIPVERIEQASQPLKTKKTTKSGAAETRLKKEQMTSVIWTTPLGLPIVQPYRQVKRKQIHTALQTIFISDPNVPAAGKCRCSLTVQDAF